MAKLSDFLTEDQKRGLVFQNLASIQAELDLDDEQREVMRQEVVDAMDGCSDEDLNGFFRRYYGRKV